MSVKEDKELTKRILSLESYLGLQYTVEDENGWQQHIVDEYGFIHRVLKKLFKGEKRYPWS